MPAVKVSPKFQVVIPKEVREQVGIRPGQRLEVVVWDGIIHLVPVRPIRELRGFARGIDTSVERGTDRL